MLSVQTAFGFYRRHIYVWVRTTVRPRGARVDPSKQCTDRPLFRASTGAGPTLSLGFRSHRTQDGTSAASCLSRWVPTPLARLDEKIGMCVFGSHLFRCCGQREHGGLDKLCWSASLDQWHPHEARHSAVSVMLAQGGP